MSGPPKVTIILPTRDRKDLLPGAMASCLGQDFGDLELIVVDDGSTDGTSALVASLAAVDPRVRLLRREPAGLVASLNAGFREARGQYLTWTSDDNLYDAQAIGQMIAALEARPDVGFVYADQRIVDASGRVLRDKRLPEPQTLVAEGGIGGCFLYRREVYQAVGDYSQEDALNEDDEYVMRVARSFRLLHLPVVLYSYRLHPRSLTARYEIEAILVAARTRARYARTTAERAEAAAWGWQKAGGIALRRGRRRTAMGYALRLARIRPLAALGLGIRCVLPRAVVERVRRLRRR